MQHNINEALLLTENKPSHYTMQFPVRTVWNILQCQSSFIILCQLTWTRKHQHRQDGSNDLGWQPFQSSKLHKGYGPPKPTGTLFPTNLSTKHCLNQSPHLDTNPHHLCCQSTSGPDPNPSKLTLSSPQLCLTGFAAVTLTKPLLLCNNPIDTYQCWTITAFCSVGWLKLSQCKVREENVTFEMRGGFCSTLSRNINNNDTRDSKSLQLYYKLSSLPLCLRISHPNKSWHFWLLKKLYGWELHRWFTARSSFSLQLALN